ncbi:ankyrin repeat [Fusarium mundagurra]|uniref:Ankyrin repeat n=1 Tax=Fusarium mundagurra TaxID=1567541 RepID=A0A8H5YI55_9HYPO|nr:ankyrin repeat [Fusarium mundagurra]
MLFLGSYLLCFAFLSVPTRADSGDDFSNNLFSDLAPLLALFGERVTMQFLSQSMGWADCIILAVAPLGIITTIVSAIRVDGPAWLKAIIGRSRENLSSAEMELMSSTSQETCELWNGRDVVRCQGKAPVTEFICLAPVNSGGTIKRIRFMKLSEAIEQKLVIKQGIFSVFNLSRLIHGVPKSRNHSSHYFQGGMRNLWGSIRSRRKSTDLEVPTPIPLGSRGQEAQSQSAPASELIVLRNTTTDAPNITLNRHHKVDRGHLYMVASFGILLQLGVLVYFGFITYYPTLKFKKDDKQVLGYDFPFSAGGTLVLVFGMLLCARVVDRSTTEDGYKPAPGREMRMIWLQQKQTVSDQIFGSFALYPRRCPQVVTTSQRDTRKESNRRRGGESSAVNDANLTSGQSDYKEDASSPSDLDSDPALNLTVIATGVCLAGFIIQFIGLRAMHWSASVGQLIAIIIMTILRAFVRLGFLAPINCTELRDRFELDGLALALGDPKLGPGSGPMDEVDRFDFGLSKCRTWTVVLKGDGGSESGADPDPLRDGNVKTPAEGHNLNADNLLVERRDNEAQETLGIRKHLAHLAGWRGPASKEATSLVEAIEVTANTLCPWAATDSPTLTWTIQVDAHAKDENSKTLPVSLHLNYNQEQKAWKARIDELDSVLSLWLASIDKERELTSTTAEKSKIGDDDEWFRKRSSQIRGGLILLGEHTQALKLAFDWWLPTDAPKPEEIEDSQIGERYGEAWRVVGTKYCEGHYVSPIAEYSDKGEEYGQANSDGLDEFEHEEDEEHCEQAHDSGEFESGDEDEDEETSAGGLAPPTHSPANFFCIQSNDTLEQLFARHIFQAFLWASVPKMKAPIDQHSEMEAVGTVIPGEWNNIRLRGTGLARLAGSIRSSGLMDLNHSYLTLIPPLHAYARLGELDCVIETVFDQALQQERILNWEAAYNLYNTLLDFASNFREDSFTFRRTVAMVLEYMRTIKLLPKIPESGEIQFPETESIHEKLSFRLSNGAYRQILNDMQMLYQRQQRDISEASSVLTYSDLQLKEISNCGFSRLHDLVACPDSMDSRNAFLAKMSRLPDDNRPESPVAFGDIPDELDQYIRTKDILGWNPLHYVAVWKDYEAPEWIDSLLSKGADINASDSRGWTPLHYSIWNYKSHAAARLLKQGASTKTAGVDGTTPLHIAAAGMTAHMVNDLINHPRQRADQFATDNLGRIPIHLAAQNGNEDVIDSLRLSINEKDHQGRTALHLAAFGGHLETLSKIIECGANLDVTYEHSGSGGYYTALHWATRRSKAKVANVLLSSGADVDARCHGRVTPLHYACIENNLKIADILIEHEADVNAEDRSRQTPLCYAASYGSLLCVDRLLKTPNIDINARTPSDDHGPLLFAICYGYGDIVRMLVEKGAIISQRMVEVAKLVKHQVQEEGQVGDWAEDEEEAEDDEGVLAEENKKRPGLKTEDIGKYVRAAYSLRNAFEEHVHEEMGSIVLSELIRRLCPP